MIKKPHFIFFIVFINIFYAQTITIKAITKNDIQYFSLNDFIHQNNLRSTYYQAKEKLEIVYEGNKLYFSPFSSYCKINSQSYNLTYSTLLINNNIYVPILSFKKIIEASSLSMKVLKIDKNNVEFKMNIYDIQDFYIEKKSNGIEISIQTTKHFSEKDIATSVSSSGWFNITILNSKIDSIGCKNSFIQYPVAKTHTVQSDYSSQLSFLLKQKIDEVVVVSNKNSIDLLLTIGKTTYSNKIQEIRDKWIIDTIVIDAGHGGKDPGAISSHNLKEKTVTLDIAKQLGGMLESSSDFKVIYTRTEDVFVPLWKRTQMANNLNGDIFISIHANASKHTHIKGFETYLLRVGKTDAAIEVAQRENEVISLEEKGHKYIDFDDEKLIVATMAQNAAIKQSELFADMIQTNLDKQLKSNNRGVKQAGFHVLVGASMPNVLVEVGFLSNKEEANNLNKQHHRKKIAKAIYKSIIEFKNLYE